MAELPAVADGREVDRILLARVDPARFRFAVHYDPTRSRKLADWMDALGAMLVINGSYYAPDGAAVTPIVSFGKPFGPRGYQARHGAFVVSADSVGIRDLRQEDWRSALRNAEHAMVSFPLLVAPDGARPQSSSLLRAYRSFVGEDADGRIVVGTTVNASFSLEGFAQFLASSPLALKYALNLDGGPLACEGVRIADVTRDFCGAWEPVTADPASEQRNPAGKPRPPLPIVLAVTPK
ncbi:MAG: phosphodiester glycosidase family protein [Pseudorhodoplanes sp.]